MGDLLVKISLVIPAGEARLGMDFGPTVGQYGVNIKFFCDKFNEVSSGIYKGIPLRINVKIYKDKNFDIFLKGFYIRFFIDFYLKDKDFLDIKDVYSLYLLQRKYSLKNILHIENDFSRVRSLLNYLNKSNIKCIY